MLTPQDITDKVFVKAVFGGYDMTGVDEFLEAVNTDYTSLYKENAILKGKLKVLVEKVEEYRSTEDAMRMALLTAQRMGEEITTDANKQKEDMLRNVDLEVKARLADSARRIADEELRLSVAAKETSKFIELSQAIMRKHSDFLSKLETARRAVRPDSQPAPEPEPPPAPLPTREEQIADAAHHIGNVMEKLTGGGAPRSEPAEIPYQADTQEYGGAEEQTKVYAVSDDSVTPRPKFDFENLKFGSNFSPDE
jgi:cell division initiation protein